MRPGVRADEDAFASFMPLARMSVPEPGLDWTADDWIDEMDMPRDPVGRQGRAVAREAARPAEHEGIDRLTDAMLAQAGGMVSGASRPEFLDTVSLWADPLIDRRYDKDRAVGFRSAVMARRAALAPTEEDRIAREVQRARYLADNGRRGEPHALWKELSSRIASLPEGAARMRAEAEHAGYVERTQGADAAAERWRALHERYAWSLGLLDDRLAFLARAGRGAEGRRVLAAVIPRAASGHREQLLARLTREALAAGDLPQARQSVEQLLQQPTLDQSQRLYAVHLFARLSFKEAPSFDALPLATAEAEKLTRETHADLYATLAEAADQEKAWGAAVTLWIEALNRRTERAWLHRASRSADRGGRLADLLGFFDRQQGTQPPGRTLGGGRARHQAARPRPRRRDRDGQGGGGRPPRAGGPVAGGGGPAGAGRPRRGSRPTTSRAGAVRAPRTKVSPAGGAVSSPRPARRARRWPWSRRPWPRSRARAR